MWLRRQDVRRSYSGSITFTISPHVCFLSLSFTFFNIRNFFSRLERCLSSFSAVCERLIWSKCSQNKRTTLRDFTVAWSVEVTMGYGRCENLRLRWNLMYCSDEREGLGVGICFLFHRAWNDAVIYFKSYIQCFEGLILSARQSKSETKQNNTVYNTIKLTSYLTISYLIGLSVM